MCCGAKLIQRVGEWGAISYPNRRQLQWLRNQPFDEQSLPKAIGYRDVIAHHDEAGHRERDALTEAQEA